MTALNQVSNGQNGKSISQLSASESVTSHDEENKAQQFEESVIFPLFSEISRVVVLPSIFCILQFLIQILQALTVNMFVGNHHLWNSISLTPKVIRVLSYSVNFGVIDYMNKNNIYDDDNLITMDDFFDCFPLYISVVIYFIVEVLFMIFILYWYRKKRSFMKWSLYVAYFLLSVLNPIVFTPACGLAGYAVWQIDCHQSTSSIVFLIISLIPSLLLLTLTIWNTNFTCYSVYVSRNIDASWDPKIKNALTTTLGITSFLSPVLNPFPKWCVFIGIFASIFLNIYQLYLMYYLPLIKPFMNAVLQSLCWLSISSLIISIVHYSKDINYIIFIVVPISIFIVFCILYAFFVNFRIKSALSKMNIEQEDYSEKDKRDFLESINLGSNEMAIFYVRVGLVYLSPLCVDFSFMKYIANIRQSSKILFPLIKLTAMIPAQMQFLSQLIATVNRSGAVFNTIQNYILYQARKVHVIRQSVSSKEEINEAKLLYKMSEETISLVRGFWGEISHTKGNISTASLRYFRNSSLRTSSSYLDAIDQFPRSQKIYDQYIRFLIEAMGNYKSSVHYSKCFNMIEKGHRVVHDYAFRSFANAFPQYLTENIFDLHGMYVSNKEAIMPIQNQTQTQTEMISTNISTVIGSSSLNSSDFRNDDIASEIFEHSKLRLALQDVIDKSSMKSLNILRGLSIASAVLILIFFIINVSIVESAVDAPFELMQTNTLFSKITTSLQYSSLIVGTRLLEYASDTDNLGPLLASQLSINLDDLPDEPSAFKDSYLKLNMLNEEIRDLLQQGLEIIFNKPSKHYGEIDILSHWSQTDYQEIYYDQTLARVSLRAAIYLYLSQIYQISSLQPIGIKSEAALALCMTTCYNGYSTSRGFEQLYQNITQTGIDECERYSGIFDILMYVISAVAVVLFFIVRIINFIYVIREFKYLSTLLRGFNKDEMEASLKPIYLKSKEKLPTGTVHSAHDFSIEIFIIPFIFLLVTADCIFVVIYSGILNQDFFDSFADAFEWSNGGAQRALTLMKLMLAICIDHSLMSVRLGKATNESTSGMQSNIDLIMKFQNQLDLEIIGKNDKFDEFYYSDRCKSIEGTYNYAKFIDCISLSNKINLATSYFNMMKKNYQLTQIFMTFEFAGIAYSIDKSIYKEFISFQEYLLTYTKNISDEHNQNIEMITIIGIVILIILIIFENFFIGMLNNSFAGFKQLIYTLPPVSVCQNRPLMNFLSRLKTNQELPSEAELIINSSNFGIISINESLIIQTVNPTFIKMTGITSHKLLGQSISYLIPLPSDEKNNIVYEKSPFYCTVDEMRKTSLNGQNVRTVKIKIINQNFETIHMSATLIKLTDDFGKFRGITILMKNIEETVELKKKLIQEKSNTEQLLNALIPKGALNSVKGKKHSVLFKADFATLMFIEITGINECISMMSPKGLMSILEQIYNCIDSTMKKFDSISMIRWENDMIFAVSGLFDFVEDYKKQAFETVAFLIDLIRQLDEINIQVSTDFHLRLGAHLGGPVNGFVQNPDTPCFDIRSGVFKYLNYMKEKDAVDQVQVTDSVVKNLDLSIFDVSKDSTFEFEGGSEDVFLVKYKDGYNSPQNNDSIIIEEEEENLANEEKPDAHEFENSLKEENEEKNEIKENEEENEKDEIKNEIEIEKEKENENEEEKEKDEDENENENNDSGNHEST